MGEVITDEAHHRVVHNTLGTVRQLQLDQTTQLPVRELKTTGHIN